MRVPRIFVDAELRCGSLLELPQAPARYVHRVLRLSAGAPLSLFNGLGGEYEGQLDRAAKSRLWVRVGAHRTEDHEPERELGLAQAVSRGAKMDYAIQKAVELGVSWIQPLVAERSVVRLDHQRAPSRLEHWRGVARSACEQCGRNRVPSIRPVREVAEWVAEPPGAHCDSAATRLVLDPGAATSIGRAPAVGRQIRMLVGPEGGLTVDELAAAERAGFQPVHLGPRILRTETAAVAAITIIQLLWGDLAGS